MNSNEVNKSREQLDLSLKNGELNVPVLPKAANDILLMSQDPNADMADLSKLIHQDQSIAGSVLRIANSAAFAASEKIVSLQQAVARLGMQLLTEIALSVAVQANVFKSPKYDSEIKLMWRQALASGIYGKEVSRFLHRNVEGQYLCGLLHAIGKPVVLREIEKIEKSLNVSLTPTEVNELIERFHVRVGSLVTSKWKLPQPVQIASAYYQIYKTAPEFKTETAITYLSDKLALTITAADEIDEKQFLFDPVFEVLNIFPYDRTSLLEKKEDVKIIVNSMSF